MGRRLVILFFIGLALSLSSCSGPVPVPSTLPGPTVTYNPNAEPSRTPFSPATEVPSLPFDSPTPVSAITTVPASTASLAPTAAKALPQYTLDATLNYAAHTLAADEVILYQNSTGVSLSSLVLAVEPNLWKNCFHLGGLMVYGEMVADYTLNGNRLDLPLASPLPPDGSLNILLHFDLSLPPANVYHVFGYNELQTNLVDWYPFIVPYSNGWLIHPPSNVGENLVYEASDFDVTLRQADSSAPVVFAAGAPAQAGTGMWVYHLDRARTFAFSASPDYLSTSVSVNSIPLTGYYFESEKGQALAALNEVAKAVTTYSALFGPYPYASLSMVESPYFDGMEYDGLFFLGQDYYMASNGTVLNNLVDIAVHETAHQWWFGLVGDDQALQPWLDEALATYSERLFYEQNYPEVTAWENFRVDSFSPSGWVDSNIYDGFDFRSYANAVYLRGAQFLQALRLRMGDPAFFAFLKDYATQMAGKISTTQDFFRILRQHTTANLSDITSTYFLHAP